MNIRGYICTCLALFSFSSLFDFSNIRYCSSTLRCYIKPSYGDGKKNLFAMKPIGELIKERLKAEERSVAWFARKLSCSRANVYKIFCKEYIDTELLTRISRILNYDFFQYFSEHLKEE